MDPSSDFDSSFQMGYRMAPFIVAALLVTGLFISIWLSRRACTNRKCALSLVVVLSGLLVGGMLNLTGAQGTAFGLIGLLAFIFAPISGLVMAIIGLIEYSENRRTFRHGVGPAIFALVIATLHLAFFLFTAHLERVRMRNAAINCQFEHQLANR